MIMLDVKANEEFMLRNVLTGENVDIYRFSCNQDGYGSFDHKLCGVMKKPQWERCLNSTLQRVLEGVYEIVR